MVNFFCDPDVAQFLTIGAGELKVRIPKSPTVENGGKVPGPVLQLGRGDGTGDSTLGELSVFRRSHLHRYHKGYRRIRP